MSNTARTNISKLKPILASPRDPGYEKKGFKVSGGGSSYKQITRRGQNNSVGQSEGLLIPRSSVRFRQKPKNRELKSIRI